MLAETASDDHRRGLLGEVAQVTLPGLFCVIELLPVAQAESQQNRRWQSPYSTETPTGMPMAGEAKLAIDGKVPRRRPISPFTFAAHTGEMDSQPIASVPLVSYEPGNWILGG